MTTTIDDNHVVGSLGSDFWRIKVQPILIPTMAREIDWKRLGRRVMIDAKERIIAWIIPSSTHEIWSDATDMTVKVASLILKNLSDPCAKGAGRAQRPKKQGS